MANPNTNKRKRDRLDQGVGPQPHSQPSDNYAQFLHQTADGEPNLAEVLANHNAMRGSHGANASVNGRNTSASDTASAALHYSMGAPPAHDPSFLVGDDSADHTEPSGEPNFDIDAPTRSGPGAHDPEFAVDPMKSSSTGQHNSGPTDSPNPTSTTPAPPGQQPGHTHSRTPSQGEEGDDPSLSPSNQTSSTSRHKVGSEEWAASRRLAHKEVERRRREAINDGISELGKIVPGAERNKGQILARAVLYIAELKDRQQQTEQKNNLEKMMFEQAIAEITATADKLKGDVRRLEGELESRRGR